MRESQVQPTRVVIAGGSIAAVTTADTLRTEGFEGEIRIISAERHLPYSRVPLSKGVLAGREETASAILPPLDGDVVITLDASARSADPERKRVLLSTGEVVPYDDLIIATGARARRLAAPSQRGEHVVRSLDDAVALSSSIGAASSAVIVGGGFLGMEIASTCIELGLAVTVVDREPPLQRVLGPWLSAQIVSAAREKGVDIVVAQEGVRYVGYEDIDGVDVDMRILEADLYISAVGDVPNVEWLEGSGLRVAGGVVADDHGRVAESVFAVGDVSVTQDGNGRMSRSPHWTSAVAQAQVAARTIVHGDDAAPLRSDPYFWTEQFGLDVKVSGLIPAGSPEILAGDQARLSMLLQWAEDGSAVAAASVNHRMSIARLKALGARARQLVV
jgi:NADPH-dependent 2,4-dienoyl-CoA reductase/sulfur reductase-like enzyme